MIPDSGRTRTGRLGEEIACDVLGKRGYRIVERNWRGAHQASGGAIRGEIDIVARDGEWWVFAEVKTRRGRSVGLPEEAMTQRKVKRVAALAQTYLALHNLGDVDWRIDLVAIELNRDDAVTGVRVIPSVGLE
jgi:putative endonuclease